ncbi:MAG: acyl-CoA synthetase [Nocardia sp.]|uniref:AMP-binding protein n=1 Tax=Nocardia sp. TaxID=1821 RepID=UPI0026338853|nr:AMP-binding protein [Nocardia sp.]MCU1647863.1 acyl-CoA synthetase [Nocardia sp.]
MDPVSSPFAVIEGRPMYRLRRYFPEHPADGPAALLVPPLMMTAEVFDLDVEDGAVAMLHRAGIDPWVLDFGSPATEENGWERTLDDHVLAVSAVIDTVGKSTGREVNLVGYCQGGMFGYLAATHRSGEGVASIVAIGSMVDWTAAGLPFGPRVANHLAETVREGAQITDTILKTWWDLVDPVNTVRNRVRTLRNRSAPALSPAEVRRRQFMAGEGRIGYPGPAASDLLRQFAIGNRLLNGGFVVGDRVHSMGELTCPILGIVGRRDQLAPGASVRGIRSAARSAPVYEVSVDTGHYKMVAGSTAVRTTWPVIAGWLHWHGSDGPRPEQIVDMPEATARSPRPQTRTKRMLFAPPRPARPGKILPDTRISPGLAWSARTSSRDCLLYAGRMRTEAGVNARIDAVVRTLIAVGVEPAERVGVVMGMRPGALIAVAALSRLGAVAVLLPGDENLSAAVNLTGTGTVVAGPADIDRVGEHDYRLLTLGDDEVRNTPKLLADNEVDLDAVDTSAVRLPDWYRPNPGTADEVAFLAVTFATSTPTVERITNRQWAVRAYAAVPTTGIDYRDTLYCAGALSDPHVLTEIGAALVSGARIALASEASPEQIESEARRYGASLIARAGNSAVRQ